MKTYLGRRVPGKCIVTVQPTGQMIKARLDRKLSTEKDNGKK